MTPQELAENIAQSWWLDQSPMGVRISAEAVAHARRPLRQDEGLSPRSPFVSDETSACYQNIRDCATRLVNLAVIRYGDGFTIRIAPINTKEMEVSE